jgi:succinate dehydrogenase/fumarate reductase flavoprotein subunit
VEKGAVKRAQTISELARVTAIDFLALEETVKRYNEDFDRGADSWYFKNSGHHAIRVPPFYAVEVRACMIGLTAAGLEIDTQCRVLDLHGRPIPGLYAAGEVLGCVMGNRYSAGGVSIANAIVFGRLSGQSAAASALECAPIHKTTANVR